jgi:hypothetical protein
MFLFSTLVPLEDFLNGTIHQLLDVGSNSSGDLEIIRTELIKDLSPIVGHI